MSLFLGKMCPKVVWTLILCAHSSEVGCVLYGNLCVNVCSVIWLLTQNW